LTVPLHQRAHDHDATLPPVVLVKRKYVAGGQQQIQPAKHGAKGKQTGNQIEDDPAQMDKQLSAHRSFLQGSSVERDKRADRYGAEAETYAANSNTGQTGTDTKAQFRGGNTAASSSQKMAQLVNDHGESNENYK
jgi:hypothetical protein